MLALAIALCCAGVAMGIVGIVTESAALMVGMFVALTAAIPVMYAYTRGGRNHLHHR